MLDEGGVLSGTSALYDAMDLSGGEHYLLGGNITLDKAQDELSSYKKRIDANVEHQREHSDMMATLQRKVQEYRRRFADIEDHLAASRKPADDVTFNLREVKEDYVPRVNMSKSYDEGDLELASQLDDERRRAEELRLLFEQERAQNDQLQTEIQHLRQQFELSLMEKDRLYQSRERVCFIFYYY
ncbi:unnamed protein product [Anisakis simplex]|uniref:IF rod domain-containing protein n=1 Tax=Anisakis simplex TaxID=6269 RepID=A0A0M3KDA9_ANISI|nr:unnamed protein product [Anisakis simplex]